MNLASKPVPRMASPEPNGGFNTITLTPLGGPTVLMDLNGLRILTDPTLDPPQLYPVGDRVLEKTTHSAMTCAELGALDLVLLSHDQHPDNLDNLGRQVVAGTPTLTTEIAAQRLGGMAQALATWNSTTVRGQRGQGVTVTAVPAQHGPDNTEHLTGPVTGFVVSGDDVPTIYVSGDNASLDVVREIARRFPSIDVAILFAGAARTPLVDGPLTLTSRDAVEAARILGMPRVLSAHTDGWRHFTEDRSTFVLAFEAAGLSQLLLPADEGRSVRL